MKFAYWATNLGGLVFSDVPQRTESSFAFNAELARQAETVGFDYVLLAARFMATAGGTPDLHDALATTAALAAVTDKLKLIAAVHSGLWHPALIAKMGSTIDAISNGRFCINIISGWFKDEFLRYGEAWLDHDERYRRSEEFIEVLSGLWQQDNFDFHGDFYRIHQSTQYPHPVSSPRPEIFQGGSSKAARRMAARYADYYLMNGDTLEGAGEQIREITELAAAYGRRPKFGINGFAIVRESEAEALAELERIIAHASTDAVKAFAGHVQNAGASTREKVGMWADSSFANLVQPNDGFRTGLIGTATQVAERIREYEAIGIDLVLCGFLNYADELADFGRGVIPLVNRNP